MSFLLSGVITLAVVLGASCDRELNVAQYAKLPRIYEYDDFSTCRRKCTDFVYCVAIVQLLPDDTNELWNNITFLTTNRRNFPHDQLERGLCVNEYYLGTNDDRRVKDIVATHAFDQIYNKYGLRTRTEVDSCWTSENFDPGRTMGERSFMCISLLLLIVTMYATCVNHHGQFSNGRTFVDAFAIQHNIRRLTKGHGANAQPFFDGLRAIGMVTILIVHAQLPMLRMPVKNTDDLEAQANHFVFPLINSGNTHMIQFFFTLGGMVFGLSCLNHIEGCRTFNGMYFVEKLLRRLIRILPSYAFIIFYQATCYRRVKQGPLEYKFDDYCAEHWWTNVLFVNNYVLPTKPCLQYGWYLGADFHLFLLGSLLLALIWRFPRTKRIVAFLMAIAALLIPACILYAGSMAATMTFDMRHALAELRTYDHFLKYYLPTHTNVGGYFFGMIAAMVHRGVAKRDQQPDRFRPLLTRAFALCSVVLVGLNAFTMVLPGLELNRSFVLFHAIYGTLLKASWGCFYAVSFLLLAWASKSFVVSTLSHPLMQCLARLSYCVYVVQYSVIYGLYSNFPVPLMYGTFNLLILTSASVLLSIVSALLLHIAVEAPIGHLGNRVLTSLLRRKGVSNENGAKHSKQM